MKKNQLEEYGYNMMEKGTVNVGEEHLLDFFKNKAKKRYSDCKFYHRKSGKKIVYEVYAKLPEDNTIRTVGELKDAISNFDDDARLIITPSTTDYFPEKKSEDCDDCFIMANVFVFQGSVEGKLVKKR